MKTAMESIKEMVDVNTVVGDPVESPDGSVIVPVSRVTFGFAAGGGEYETGERERRSGGDGTEMPFAGGSGAGVTVQPVGFLVVGQGTVRLLPVDGGAVFDRLIDLAPHVMTQIGGLIRRNPQAAPAVTPGEGP
jgi:sporulation protein YtfJ